MDMDVRFIMHIHRNGFSLRNASAVMSMGICMKGAASNHCLNLARYASASSGVGSGRLSRSLRVVMFRLGGKSDAMQLCIEHAFDLAWSWEWVGSAVAAAANESSRLGNAGDDVLDNGGYECVLRDPVS
jgi:hypothetical protein